MLKTALVTGASRGIGAAVAKGLAADGYQVAGVYCYSRDAMEELAAACGVIPIAADLSQTDALPELAGTVLEHLGHVDVLVNNAACSYINLFQCLPPELTIDDCRELPISKPNRKEVRRAILKYSADRFREE